MLVVPLQRELGQVRSELEMSRKHIRGLETTANQMRSQLDRSLHEHAATLDASSKAHLTRIQTLEQSLAEKELTLSSLQAQLQMNFARMQYLGQAVGDRERVSTEVQRAIATLQGYHTTLVTSGSRVPVSRSDPLIARAETHDVSLLPANTVSSSRVGSAANCTGGTDGAALSTNAHVRQLKHSAAFGASSGHGATATSAGGRSVSGAVTTSGAPIISSVTLGGKLHAKASLASDAHRQGHSQEQISAAVRREAQAEDDGVNGVEDANTTVNDDDVEVDSEAHANL